jgi:hypothetical protein
MDVPGDRAKMTGPAQRESLAGPRYKIFVRHCAADAAVTPTDATTAADYVLRLLPGSRSGVVSGSVARFDVLAGCKRGEGFAYTRGRVLTPAVATGCRQIPPARDISPGRAGPRERRMLLYLHAIVNPRISVGDEGCFACGRGALSCRDGAVPGSCVDTCPIVS